MAELVLKIDPGSGYEDGDVLCAFNERRIRCVHAEHICHRRLARRNSSGLIVIGEVFQDWAELNHRYRFERVSASEVKRVEISTGTEEVFSEKPNARGESIDVRLFIARRKSKGDHFLIGEDGREVWYGERLLPTTAVVSAVWDAIETKTPHVRTAPQFNKWPITPQELRSHLAVSVDEFDDAQADDLVSPLVDDVDQSVILAKRSTNIDWESSLNLPANVRVDVRNKDKEVDVRNTVHVRANITRKKPKPNRVADAER